MSRRKFRSGDSGVVAGWDRPLQHFFLDVYDMSVPMAAGEDEICLYSSLDELPEVYEHYSLEDIIANLEDMNITAPAMFLKDLLADRLNNVGNLEVNYPAVNQEPQPRLRTYTVTYGGQKHIDAISGQEAFERFCMWITKEVGQGKIGLVLEPDDVPKPTARQMYEDDDEVW